MMAIGLATATAALAACGDGGEPQAPRASAPPTASAAPATDADAAFVTQAEEVCAGYLERLPELPTSIDQVAVWFDETEANLTAAVDEFRELDYPKDAAGAGVRSVLVAELGGSLSDLRFIRMDFDEAVRAKDRTAVAEVGERLELFAASPPDTERVLASAGLTTCDEAFGPGPA